MKNEPLVTVLMPAYNAENFIEEAIKSLLDQTFKKFEVLIIDDGSTDTTFEIIAKYQQKDDRIRVLKNKRNSGICKTLNRGINKARGKYLARMDADDWSYPKRLEKQVNFMDGNPRAVVCGGTIEVCDSFLNALNTRNYPNLDQEIRQKIFRLNPFAHPAVMMKTAAVKKVGGYNPALAGVEDYDLYFRLGHHGKFANLPDTLLKLRTHPASISAQNIQRQAWLNLYVRLKAIAEYGYPANLFDKFFLVGNLLANLLTPPSLKFRLYNWYRKIYA